VGDEGQYVVDLLQEEMFVRQGPEAAFACAVAPGGAHVSQLEVCGDELPELERADRAAVVGHDGQGGVTLPSSSLVHASTSATERVLVVGQGEFDRGDRVVPVRGRRDVPGCSYFDQ